MKGTDPKGSTAPRGKPPASKWHREPQTLSNAQLAAAVPVLKKTIATLSQADHDYGGHRTGRSRTCKPPSPSWKEPCKHRNDSVVPLLFLNSERTPP